MIKQPTYLKYLVALLLFGSATNISAQTTFSNSAPASAITHHYYADFEMGGGCAFFDFNQDSLLDIYYTGGLNQDALYQNNGNGTFTNVSMTAGLGATSSITTVGVHTGDIDNDGYREIFVTTMPGYPNILWKNNGNGTFTDISTAAGLTNDTLFTMGACFGDYNKDGLLDLYVANYIDTVGGLFDSLGNVIGFSHLCIKNQLFLNNGNQTFSDVSTLTGVDDQGCTLATVFTDYDQDGDIDIYNANDFGIWLTPNVLLENDYPTNSFTDVSMATNLNKRMFGMGIAIGDYDQDMDLDYYITNIGRNVLYQNNGNGTYTDTTAAAGVEDEWVIQDSTHATGWGTGFMDVDNDSDLDLFVSNGYIGAESFLRTTRTDPDQLYLNNGDATFSAISNNAGIRDSSICRGFAYGDYNNDGAIDLAVVRIIINVDPDTLPVVLYENTLSNGKNWLKVNLEGTVSNRDAFGSQITIHVGGKSWIHEVSGGGSHASQHSTIAHFGLDTATIVDSLVVQWPNGLVETVYSIGVNQTLYLVETMMTNVTEAIQSPLNFKLFPNPAQDKVVMRFHLAETSAVNWIITDLLGRQVYESQEELNKGEHQLIWNIQKKCPNGVYLVHVDINGQKEVRKVLVQN